jgi:preprotein translocase subunit SecA
MWKHDSGQFARALYPSHVQARPTGKNSMAVPSGIGARLQAILGMPAGRRLARWSLWLPRIEACEAEVRPLSEADLRKRSLALRYRAKSREPLARLLPEAFALVREAGRRALNMRHFDVQLLGGIAMHHRSIVEMQTGEGKTLTATLPMYLEALAGRGAHLATANDYLAQRDADWMRPIYSMLGMTVGVIQAQQPRPARRDAYACDVTYGTAKEFGFDFLRDRLLIRRLGGPQQSGLARLLAGDGEAPSESPVQRECHFALIDEADSLLIDEARTPLIISALPGESVKRKIECFQWSAQAADQLTEKEHYDYDPEKQTVDLTPRGRQRVRMLPKSPALDPLGMPEIYEHVERSIRVQRAFLRDRHYVVRDGEIVIVDEFTGRLGEGRKWRDGIHQAIEAKEGVKVTVDSGQAARITVQDLFLRYERLAGMTGTASDSARELRRIYRARVVPVPTNRPSGRRRLPTWVFGDIQAKWAAVVTEVREVHGTGRPVLIGTRSIDKSQQLSELLRDAGIEHQVLNAHQVAVEADIVARAGQRDKVTVSTNMAGRGTDIKLGEGVAELGGLHVICTELHDSARIDRQLIGRCGRQGDPGSYRQYLALDDDILLYGLGPAKAAALSRRGKGSAARWDRMESLFYKAQRKIERRHYRDRKALMHFEQEKKKMHKQMGQDPYLDTPT